MLSLGCESNTENKGASVILRWKLVTGPRSPPLIVILSQNLYHSVQFVHSRDSTGH